MALTSSLRLDSFEVRLTDIAEVPLNDLQALSMGVGWPHRPNDWRALLELGEGVVALDEIGRVVGSSMWFPMGEGFATIGMVITSPRLQALGAGRTMMDVGLAALKGRELGLNATRQAKQLYRSIGFIPERISMQYQGQVRAPVLEPLARGETLRALSWADMDALAALDADAFGVDRCPVLHLLMAQGEGLALEREGRIVAYAFLRCFGRGSVIGPVVAETDADAIAVTGPHLVNLAGTFGRVDTRRESGAFPAFLMDAGLGIYDTVTTMSLGRPWADGLGRTRSSPGPHIYGLMAQAIG